METGFSTPEIAAYTYCLFTVFTVLFQIALASGAPWGHLAMGGRFPGRFPLKMRIAALVQTALLALLALIVLTRADLLLPDVHALSGSAIWAVVVIMAISLAMNLATPSQWERRIWAPVVAVLLICSILVALS